MKTKIFLLIIAVFLAFSCKRKVNPKPLAYFRMSFPEHEYQTYNTDTCPYTFEYPVYSNITMANDIEYHPCWIDINFPQYKAHIHITLRKIDNNLDSLLEDSHTLVYKHVIKADAIEARDYADDSLHVFATIFDIEGNAASPLQFRITDSTKFFVHGSLYFRVRPNSDSLAPAVDFAKKDVIHLIETWKWKNIGTDACF